MSSIDDEVKVERQLQRKTNYVTWKRKFRPAARSKIVLKIRGERNSPGVFAFFGPLFRDS
jgi:hypothetical protein